MYFLFVDESGSPEKNDPSLLFALVGIAFQAEKYKSFTSFYNAIKYSFYPEIMKKPLTMNPKRDKLIREEQELKEILKPKNANSRNERFMKIALNYCIDKCEISVHPVIFLKEQLDNEPTGLWVYPLAFKRLLTSFNNFLLVKKENGIVVLDSRDPVSDDKLIASFYSHTSRDPFGIACNNIVGPPFFARSLMTYGLQFAHHMAYTVFGHYFNTYYEKRGGSSYSYLRPYWNRISNSSLFGSVNNLKGIIVWQ